MRVKEAELAEIVGKTDRTVRNWVDEGCPRGDDGQFDVPEVIDWLSTRNSGRAAATEQKTRLTRAQADKAELEAAKLRAELVPVDEVQKEWNRMLGAFRARALALPSKVASQTVSAAKRFEEHRRILDDAVYEFLGELAGFKPGGDLPGPEPGRAKAAAKADGKRVGGSRKKAQPRGKRGARTVENGKGAVSKGGARRVQRPKRGAGRVDVKRTGRKDRNSQ